MSERMIYQTDETRQKILIASEALFLEKGFFDTQMKHVAEKVGISRNTLYRYHQDKADLGFAVLEMVFSKFAATLEELLEKKKLEDFSNVREYLITLLIDSLTKEDKETDFRFMAEFDAYFSGARVFEGFQSRVLSLFPEHLIDVFLGILVQGMEEGSIRKDIPPLQLLSVLFYSMKTMHQAALSRGSALIGVDSKDVANLAPIQVKLLSDGIKPQV